MKYTCPTEFNDPFDSQPHYDETAIQEIGKNRPDYLREAARRRGWSFSQSFHNRRRMITAAQHKIRSGQLHQELMSSVGVVSLTRDPLSVLMWSHYADSHKGFVLEFEIPEYGSRGDLQRLGELLIPVPIKYVEQRPVLSVGIEREQELLEKLFLTKRDCWSYEEEERVIDKERGPGIHSYAREEVLSSVIMGLKMRKEDRLAIENATEVAGKMSRKDLKAYEVSIFPGSFGLYVPNHPRLDRIRNGHNDLKT